jgi:hypothetical protein
MWSKINWIIYYEKGMNQNWTLQETQENTILLLLVWPKQTNILQVNYHIPLHNVCYLILFQNLTV